MYVYAYNLYMFTFIYVHYKILSVEYDASNSYFSFPVKNDFSIVYSVLCSIALDNVCVFKFI